MDDGQPEDDRTGRGGDAEATDAADDGAEAKCTEACGRCGLSSVVDAAGDGAGRDPYGDARIELRESELRAASRHVELLGRVKDRLDDFARRVAYGR